MDDETPPLGAPPPPGPLPSTLDEMRTRLKPFLEANPASSVVPREAPGGAEDLVVKNPWGDESVAIVMPANSLALINALNSVILPPRFTAIRHVDTGDVEVIFTAFPLKGESVDVLDRHFVFSYRGSNYVCEFARASDRLLVIAEHAKPTSNSLTEYRNLQSFTYYAEYHAENSELKQYSPIPVGDPLCFWIRNIKLTDDEMLTFVRSLNFFMSYYDTKTPTILLHTPKLESIVGQPQQRYRIGVFPTHVSSQDVDEALLHFWEASRAGDPINRFLFSYRIIEYTSYTYLELEARAAIRKLLRSPHAFHDISATSDEVVGLLQRSKLDPVPRFDSVLRDMVEPNVLWREIGRNSDFFASGTRFDGGYTIGPLISSKSWTEKDFGPNGIATFGRMVRDIRNALSHGRDQKTANVITPTAHNFERLQPWASLMSIAAGEVMVYKSTCD